jgi:VanZ family protein
VADPRTIAALRWLPFAAGCLVIFVLSSMSRPPVPEALWFAHSDKLLHAAAYALLAGLAVIGAGRARPWLALALTVAYGGIDEIHQSFVPGRESSALDCAADAFGAAVVVALARTRRPRHHPS